MSADGLALDVWRTVARRKLNAPPEWEWYALEVLNDAHDVLVTGGIPNVGKRGRAKWKGIVGTKVVVTRAEKVALEEEYEQETGKCRECYGEGQTVASFGTAGTTFRQCGRCKGSGHPTEVAA